MRGSGGAHPGHSSLLAMSWLLLGRTRTRAPDVFVSAWLMALDHLYGAVGGPLRRRALGIFPGPIAHRSRIDRPRAGSAPRSGCHLPFSCPRHRGHRAAKRRTPITQDGKVQGSQGTLLFRSLPGGATLLTHRGQREPRTRSAATQAMETTMPDIEHGKPRNTSDGYSLCWPRSTASTRTDLRVRRGLWVSPRQGARAKQEPAAMLAQAG